MKISIFFNDRDAQISPARIGRNLTVIFIQDHMKISIFFDDRDAQITPTRIGRWKQNHSVLYFSYLSRFATGLIVVKKIDR